MLKTRVIPCLTVKNNGLVKTVGFKTPKYLGDPINTVKLFNDKEVDELIFLDISASIDNKSIDYELIQEVASECFMPVCYGGGIKSIDEIRKILQLGIEKVALNTSAAENPELIRQAAELFGSSTIVGSIDVRRNFLGKYEVFTLSGTKNIKKDPVEMALELERLGVGEILINSIDNDGKMSGYDIKLIRMVTDAVKVPVIACGGAGNVDDLVKASKEGRASAVAAGSLFVFHGPHRAVLINFPERKKLEEKLD